MFVSAVFVWSSVFVLCSGGTVRAETSVDGEKASTGRSDQPDLTSPDFTNDVQPILAKRCFACHGPDVAEGGLRFTDRESAIAEGDSGEITIVPGDASASHLIARVIADDDSDFERMPPEGDAVTQREVEILRRWIQDGAKWKKHWAFEPLTAPPVPVVEDSRWGMHPVDSFVRHRLADSGLSPNERADRRTLIRRAHYDLLGLPPTADQIQEFENDPDPDAFSKLVDRLLESPHYGERWGRHWLDLVRYAETNSFERDGVKPNAWKYRDYVIKSLNDDKPYDQFVREQLAGDELDHVTTETLTATGFFRLGIWDDEPADPMQAVFDEKDDLITTVSQGLLGLTINCARCHDHKIDPIPQKDYYQLLAFFGDVTTYARRGDTVTNNQIDVSADEIRNAYTKADERETSLKASIRELEQAGIAKMSGPDQRATEGAAKDRNRVLKAHLKDHLNEGQWKTYQSLKAELVAANKARKHLPARDQILGLAVCIPQPEATHVLYRGSPHSPTDEVGLGFPEIFGDAPPKTPAEPTPRGTAGRRRILADWMFQPENRLTSRVIANRIWQFHFGRGIVRSSNNFG
ncbi:MAG: DUF1549 domain-containing protein, partial [Planctomycetota bacterium]